MNKEKLKAMEIFQLVVILFITLINYIGFTYLVDGNFIVSVFVIAASFGLYTVSYYYVSDRNNKSQIMNKNFVSFYSLFFLVLFALFLFNWFLTAHTYNIMSNCKTSLKEESSLKIDDVRAAILDYKNRYQQDFKNLDYLTLSKLSNLNPTSINELSGFPYNVSQSVLNNPSSINPVAIKNNVLKRVQQEHNINTVDSSLNKELDKIAKVYDNFTLFRLANNYSNLNKNLEKIVASLNKKVEKLPYSNQAIQISFPKNELVLSQPFELAKKFQLGLLLPLFVSLFLNSILLIRFINADYIQYNEKTQSKKTANKSGNSINSKGPIEY
jgi:hypothetical protein